jgi:protein-tyrosine phosphatase
MRILMVCLGNICRSPMADGLLRRKIAERNLPFEVDSAGTANYHVGKAPDTRMIATGNRFQTPIDDLRARQFSQKDFQDFDLIFCMDAENRKNVLKLAQSSAEKEKVRLLLNELNPGSDLEVPDPYFGSSKDFEDVYHLLDRATEALITKLTQHASR